MKKIIEFQAKLDASEFNKDIEAMRRTAKDIYAPADQIRQQALMQQRMGQMGVQMPGGGANTMASYRAATSAADQKFRQELMKEVESLEQKKKLLADHAKRMEESQRAYDNILKAGREDLQLQKRISDEMKNHKSLQDQIAAKTQSINLGMKEYLDRQPASKGKELAESFSRGGTSGVISKGVEMAGGAEALLLMGVAGAAVFALKSAVAVAENLARDFASMRRVTASAQASAIQGSSGQYLGNVYAGRSTFETGFAGERATALQRAMDEDRVGRGIDSMKAGDFGSIGNAIMDVQPGLRQGIGGAFSLFSGDKQRARFFGQLGHEGSMKKYEALQAEDLINNFQQNFEAEKALDPMKQLAMQNYESTYGRDVGIQRRLGLTDGGLYGAPASSFSSADRYAGRRRGFFEDVQGAGFMTQQGIDAMGNIMSAGGSTRAGRDASSALRFERGNNLTNASQVYGSLSGTLGDTTRSKNAMIEMLAEGTRLGLNKSEFAEEQRKFVEASAAIVSRGYGGTDADNARMAEMFGSGVANRTNAGIGAASASMDYYSQISGTATGAEGSMGFASLMSDPATKGLGSIDLQALNAMKFEDVTTNNPQIRAMAAKAGKTPQEIVDAKNRADKGKFFKSGEMQKKAASLGERITAAGYGGMSVEDLTTMADAGDETAKGIVNDFGSMSSYLQNTSGITDSKTIQSHTLRMLGLGAGDKAGEKGAAWDLFNSEGSTTGDKVTSARAREEGMVTDKTRNMLGDFSRMAEVSKSMSADMVNAMLKIQAIIKDIDSVKSEDVKNKMYKTINDSVAVFNNAADGVRPSAAGKQSQTGKP